MVDRCVPHRAVRIDRLTFPELGFLPPCWEPRKVLPWRGRASILWPGKGQAAWRLGAGKLGKRSLLEVICICATFTDKKTEAW